MRELMTDYLVAMQTAIGRIDPLQLEAVVQELFRAFLSGRHVYTLGNGASAALASHMACDLGKGAAVDVGSGVATTDARRLRVTSLVDNVALLTAYSNDVCYEDVFVEQLKNVLAPSDVVIGVSGSGGSPNVLRAMEYARSRFAVTIGFTGHMLSAEKLRAVCDVTLQAPITMMEQIEDAHVICHHAVSLAFRQQVALYHQTRPQRLFPQLDADLFAANDD